jgi:hypothetical protein
MRLTQIVEPRKAVQMWRERRGDEARKYALERELEKLTHDAKAGLIAAVVSDQPASFTELQGVLAFSEERLVSAMTELHTLFLLPQPSVVEGEQRYHLNANTKRLILSVEGAVALGNQSTANTRMVVSSNCSAPADHSATCCDKDVQIDSADAPFGNRLQQLTSLSSPSSLPAEFSASINPSLYTTMAGATA